MGIFDKIRKRNDVLDYTDKTKYSLRKPKAKLTQNSVNQIQQYTPTQASSNSNSEVSPLGFLSNLANASPAQSPNLSEIEDPKERLKRRLLSMTEQIEDLSNQLYRMQQRIELLEQKIKTNSSYLG